MREKLFKENYELLEKLAGKILTSNDFPNYSLRHQPEWIDENYCIYGAFIERYDTNCMQVATFYYMDNFEISNKNKGELIQDPKIIILFNKELKIARVTEFYIDNPRTAMLMTKLRTGKEAWAFLLQFDCTETSEETKEEREYNDYLNRWLKETVAQVKKNKNFFEKLESKM